MSRFTTTHDLPSAPPPEVLAEIDQAWERSRDLFDSGFSLSFEVDELVGRVRAELRSADGSIADCLSACQALALACGDPAHDLVAAA